MEFNIMKWFRRPKDRDSSDVEHFMKQINADVRDEVRSILASLSTQEEEQLKKLYFEIYNYKHLMGAKPNKTSLINNKFVVDAISANACNYENTKKIFEYVKAWDNETYLPKGIRLILKNQISDEEIKELEELYKRYNVQVKNVLKDKTDYYYISSLACKNEITKRFGNASNTLSLILSSLEFDNGKKVSKDLINYLEELLEKQDVDGRLLNKIILYKIRDIDNEHAVEDDALDDMFSLGLINSGNVLEESITTKYVNNVNEALTILKTNESRYSGLVILEIPNIYLNSNNNVIEEYSDKVYVYSTYQRINPNFIKGYITNNVDKCELYTREEILNEELDMPSLKG